MADPLVYAAGETRMGAQHSRRRRIVFILGLASIGLLALLFTHDRAAQVDHRPPARMAVFPSIILWAWERPEDLSFIDPAEIGVAFLAKTLRVDDEGVTVRPRLQPLAMPPGTVLIGVARIETGRRTADAISTDQRERLAFEIADVARLPNVKALQVDFDARTSQHNWYRSLLVELRRRLPASMPLSITALASWCLFDDWMDGLPVDEAVPMLFRMGPESAGVHRYFTRHRSFRSPLCRQSIGLATDEPPPSLPAAQRRYLFHPATPWTESALSAALALP